MYILQITKYVPVVTRVLKTHYTFEDLYNEFKLSIKLPFQTLVDHHVHNFPTQNQKL